MFTTAIAFVLKIFPFVSMYDISFTNLAICDGKHWVTPRQPLLHGTKRAGLLDKGIIQEADITLEDLRNANKTSLFNAMIEFGEMEIAIENVYF